MMSRKTMLMVLICMVLAATTVLAEPAVKIVTSDGGFRIDGGYTFGPLAVNVTTDADATIKFMWLEKDGTVNAGDVEKVYPSGETGTSATFPLRAETFQPLPFVFSIAGPDSVYIDIATTAEVIVSW